MRGQSRGDSIDHERERRFLEQVRGRLGVGDEDFESLLILLGDHGRSVLLGRNIYGEKQAKDRGLAGATKRRGSKG